MLQTYTPFTQLYNSRCGYRRCASRRRACDSVQTSPKVARKVRMRRTRPGALRTGSGATSRVSAPIAIRNLTGRAHEIGKRAFGAAGASGPTRCRRTTRISGVGKFEPWSFSLALESGAFPALFLGPPRDSSRARCARRSRGHLACATCMELGKVSTGKDNRAVLPNNTPCATSFSIFYLPRVFAIGSCVRPLARDRRQPPGFI